MIMDYQFFVKILTHTGIHEESMHAHMFRHVHTMYGAIYGAYMCAFMFEKVLVLQYYPLSLSLNFHADQSFHYRDICKIVLFFV